MNRGPELCRLAGCDQYATTAVRYRRTFNRGKHHTDLTTYLCPDHTTTGLPWANCATLNTTPIENSRRPR